MLELRITKPGPLYGGKSLVLALAAYPIFRGLSLYGMSNDVSIYVVDTATQLEQEAIVSAALAHVAYEIIVNRGAIGGMTVEEAEAWIDTNVGGITDLASAKLVMARALKAIARRLLVG